MKYTLIFLAIFAASMVRVKPDNMAISCPPPVPGQFATCASHCLPGSHQCADEEKCCSTGCGHFCFSELRFSCLFETNPLT